MEIETFEYKEKGSYLELWKSLAARNDHLTNESARVKWILGAVASVGPNLVLEVGCQTGGITKYLVEMAPIVKAVDILQENLDAAEALGASTILAFAEDLHQMEIGEYDSVVLTEVLNHAIDAEKAVANCWAKVAPGGNLVVTVPIGDRWTVKSTAREFLYPTDLARILQVGTGYNRIVIEVISHGGEDYFFACNLRKRRRRGT